MERFLMTHSLLYSWLYTMKENPYEDATNWKDPMEDFMKTLRREQTPTTAAMQRGIDFENLVTAILYGWKTVKFHWFDKGGNVTKVEDVAPDNHIWKAAADKVATFTRGGILQYKAQKPITVDGTDLLLYGRLDCLRAGQIYDIKFSSSYDVGKFIGSTQHPVYFELIPEATRFTYLVTKGNEVWPETYRRDETPDILPIISDFLRWLHDMDLFPVFEEHWRTR